MTSQDEIGALVLFSGGQDSTVCLGYALDRYARVETVGFDYGQRHSIELGCRQRVRDGIVRGFPQWAERLRSDHRIDISSFGAIGDTSLTSDAEIAITDFGSRPTHSAAPLSLPAKQASLASSASARKAMSPRH